MENCILYDWLTVSFQNVDKDTIIHLLGLQSVAWTEAETGSRLKYGHRIFFDGVSVHFTDDTDRRHNIGVCLEMSGQGCRDFETHGKGDWWILFEFIRLAKGRITRLDIAFDDFSGLISLPVMAGMARRFFFTSRSQNVRVIEESSDGDPDHMGISVCHGSKSSDIYIRCYDKRVERHAWEIPHWVRFEVQLRNDNCAGFVLAEGDLGEKLRGVVTNYLNYRCPDPADSNKRRWHVSPWWDRFIQGVAAISVNSKRDTEYNKDRLDKHVYSRNHNAIKTAILTDGLSGFLNEVFGHSEPLPEKYTKICRASDNAADILRILGETTSGQLLDCRADLNGWADALAMN